MSAGGATNTSNCGVFANSGFQSMSVRGESQPVTSVSFMPLCALVRNFTKSHAAALFWLWPFTYTPSGCSSIMRGMPAFHAGIGATP